MANAFVGVPLGSFNFGGTIGVQSTGTADTIVHRLAAAGVPGPVPPPQTATPIPIEMVALHLMSVNPIGPGGSFLFITLQSERGGPASTGTMTIRFDLEPSGPPPDQPDHGNWGSLINVAFDVRQGFLGGPIIDSGVLPLTTPGFPPALAEDWSHFPPLNSLEIDGVNRFLAGQGNRTQDFWPIGIVEESELRAIHIVQTARAVSEPSTLVLLGFGLMVLAAIGRKRLFKKM